MSGRKIGESIRRGIVDTAVVLIVLIGIDSILISTPGIFRHFARLQRDYSFFSPHMMVVHHTLSTVIGMALIFISFRLYKRVRMAWIVTVCLLPLSAVLHLYLLAGRISLIVVIELVIEGILIATRRDFRRESDPISLRLGVLMALVSILLVIVSTALGLFLMKLHFIGIHTFLDALWNSVQLLFLMDESAVSPKTPHGLLYARSAILLNWTSLISALVFILKPLIYQPISSNHDREKVRGLLARFGANPISYVDMENDKRYFFGTGVEGVIAYIVTSHVAVCSGDPLCATGDTALLVSEFMAYCHRNDLAVCFCQVMPETLDYFRSLGFGTAKYGEEAMFRLESYSIRGGKAAKVRQNIHHAQRGGVTVFEYKPLESRDREIEREIEGVSQDWLRIKKSGELSFMLGSVSLEKPGDRRYFAARDGSGRICAFVVFVPFCGGYYADVTRRKHDAPLGVMETIIIQAFETMRDEGFRWGSLGLAPLSNLAGDPRSKPLVTTLLHYVFEHMNGFYGFKALYQYKSKYAPTDWQARYLAFYPGVFTPQIAYSIVRAQNSGGVRDYLLNRVKYLFATHIRYHIDRGDRAR